MKKLSCMQKLLLVEVRSCFADATEQFTERTTGLFVYVENADETFKKALDEGATSLMLPADQSYGRSGGVEDPFGNTRWITTPL